MQRSSNQNSGNQNFDSQQVAEIMEKIAQSSQQILQSFINNQASENDNFSKNYAGLDPNSMQQIFSQLGDKMMANPQKMLEIQMKWWQDYTQLWQNTTKRMLGENSDPVIRPEPNDKRFKDDAWVEEPMFDYIKQSYLLATRFLYDCVDSVGDWDKHTANKADFYMRQFVDAMSPTNFASTNPEVIRATIESKGENLVSGLQNLLDDMERGKGKLKISMTDTSRFRLGENIASSKGKVIFQNDLMQLIQYEPLCEKVYSRPLLIIPPWINKYYILDLKPKNSFVHWALNEGFTVFMISWVNPDEKLATKSFDDYMLEGPIAALEAIELATGGSEINAIGYCLGGTLLACTLAYLEHKRDKRVKSATLLTTMTDFSEPGELGVFIDEQQIEMMEHEMAVKGYFDGSNMAEVFNLLRPNDLIWSFVINNYLLGRTPFPFDLLYWNSDSTRMPREMHSFYLRNMYLNNKIIEPNGISLDGVSINLHNIKTPTYMLSTKEDHIAPWKSTYSLTHALKGPVKFVLGASGHIAGVINPPAAQKYAYWTNQNKLDDPVSWLNEATRHEGSWWTDWKKWAYRKSGPKIDALTPGKGSLRTIEDAPGSYVKVRLDEKST